MRGWRRGRGGLLLSGRYGVMASDLGMTQNGTDSFAGEIVLFLAEHYRLLWLLRWHDSGTGSLE